MITGDGDLDRLLKVKLTGLTWDAGPTGGPSDTRSVPILVGTPEEVVQSRVPGVAITYLYDRRSPLRVRDGIDVLTRADPNDPSLGYHRFDNIELRRYSYQVDIYTRYRREMVDLSQGVYSRLRREHGFLLDDDDDAIRYQLMSMTDATLDIEEERVYRRSLTFEFDAWTLLRVDRENPQSVGAVQNIETIILDEGGVTLSDDWVPEQP